jgi:multiple sugar transport system substrate-binding protein
MRKILALLLLVFTSASFLVAEGNQESQSESVSELVFRITWDTESGRGKAIQKIVDSYNAQSDVTVIMTSGSDTTADILTSEADIFMSAYQNTRALGVQGQWVDLSEYFPRLEAIFPEQAIELGSVGESLYGIPWLGHSMALVYNADMVKNAGVDISDVTTFDQLEEVFAAVESANPGVKAMAIAGKQDGVVSWMSTPFLYSFGGQLVDENNNVVINTPEAAAGLDFYFNVIGKNYAIEGWEEYEGGAVMEAFRTQRVAFEIQGPWGVTDIWKQPEERRFNVGVLPFSQIVTNGVVGATEVSTANLSIPSYANEATIEAAVDFIEYMISREAQLMLMDGEYDADRDAYFPFRVPVRTDLREAEFFQQYPEFLAFVDGFQRAALDNPVPEWAEVKSRFVEPGLNAIALGQMTIAEYLEMIEKEASAVLD